MTAVKHQEPKRVTKLRAFVQQSGGQMLAPTNPWELLRFRGPEGVGIVWTNAKGRVSYNDVARMVESLKSAGQAWNGIGAERKKRTSNSTDRQRIVGDLRRRDGDHCFYCGDHLADGEATIEHIVPLACGGPNHMANMTLACWQCNVDAEAMDVARKVALRDQRRAARKNDDSDVVW